MELRVSIVRRHSTTIALLAFVRPHSISINKPAPIHVVSTIYKITLIANSIDIAGPYQNYSQTCNSSLLCNPSSSIGLVCMSGTCQCTSGYYWNSSNANSIGPCGENIQMKVPCRSIEFISVGSIEESEHFCFLHFEIER